MTMRATTIVVLGLFASLSVAGCGEGWALRKTKKMAMAVCECNDKACAAEKLSLLTSYVDDYTKTDTFKKGNSKENSQVIDQLSFARNCAGRLGAGPFAR